MPKLSKATKCTKCGSSCTKHKWNEEQQRWTRCPNADQSVFSPSISSIPPAYRYSVWEDYKTDTPARKVVLDYAKAIYAKLVLGEMPKKSLVYSGREFTGKTFISSILCRHLALEGFTASFVTLGVLTDMYFNDKQSYYSYVEPDILIFQFGSEIANSSATFVVKELFTSRLQKNKYTLFTSKFFISEFSQHYSKELQDFFSLDLFKEIKMR